MNGNFLANLRTLFTTGNEQQKDRREITKYYKHHNALTAHYITNPPHSHGCNIRCYKTTFIHELQNENDDNRRDVASVLTPRCRDWTRRSRQRRPRAVLLVWQFVNLHLMANSTAFASSRWLFNGITLKTAFSRSWRLLKLTTQKIGKNMTAVIYWEKSCNCSNSKHCATRERLDVTSVSTKKASSCISLDNRTEYSGDWECWTLLGYRQTFVNSQKRKPIKRE